MFSLKRICLYSCIILLILSLYNDFTKSFVSNVHYGQQKEIVIKHELKVVKIKVSNGETILSVSERVNGNNKTNISIEKIIADFKTANPHVQSDELSPHIYYFFPLYD